jgi:phosphatidylglycerophosphate synthase
MAVQGWGQTLGPHRLWLVIVAISGHCLWPISSVSAAIQGERSAANKKLCLKDLPILSPRPLLIDAGRRLALFAGVLALVVIALALVGGLTWRGAVIAQITYGLIAVGVLAGLGYHPYGRFGPANVVTLTRAAYAALLVGLLGDGTLGLGESGRWALVVAGAAALMLDGIDGWLARRSRLASAFGARFDMETDALSVLALSALVYRSGQVGAWVLTAGLMRYIFVVAGYLWPPLAAPLPPSQRRRIVCVILIVGMLAALAPPVAAPTARAICLAGLLLLIYSFGADCLRLAAASRETGATAASG